MQRLAEGIDREAALTQFRMGKHAGVPFTIEHHVLIHLIRQHRYRPVAGFAGLLAGQIRARGNRAAWILRRIDDDQPRSRRERGARAVPVERKCGGSIGMRTLTPPANRTAGS